MSSPQTSPDDDLIVLQQHTPEPSAINDTLVIGAAITAALFGVAFAVSLVAGFGIPLYGSFLTLAFFSLAVAVRRYFFDRFPDMDAAELRDLPTDPKSADRPVSAVAPLGRRPLLTRVLIACAGVFGVSLLALVPSLGPQVGDRLRRTPWGQGVRLVTSENRDLRPDEIIVGGIVTAWPQGSIGFERAAVLVMRLSSQPQPPTVLDWVIGESLVAYSKICTHAGCPVALFRERDDSLFCPCHQSTFDVGRGCVPTFGPATRALPQLPLGVDAEGFLIATGDFEEPPGPSAG